MADRSPLLAITPGDPHGIGPEVSVKAVSARPEFRYLATGAFDILREAAARYAPGIRVEKIVTPEQVREPGTIYVVEPDAGQLMFSALEPLKAGKLFGRQIHEWIVRAADLALAGQVDAVVTAPIAKTAFKTAGIDFPGHTELLAERARTTDFAMMLSCSKLRVVLATIHIPLRKVVDELTPAVLERVIRLSARTLPGWFSGRAAFRIAVAGLNPHAGEDGLLGREETEWIGPLVKRLAGEGLPVSGPYSPDTVFHRAVCGEFDAVIALYHDQGLIPIKVLGFDEGVNSTLGLPFIRTSPDHGTAFDLAWQGRANPSSMIQAIDLAAEAIRNRKQPAT